MERISATLFGNYDATENIRAYWRAPSPTA